MNVLKINPLANLSTDELRVKLKSFKSESERNKWIRSIVKVRGRKRKYE